MENKTSKLELGWGNPDFLQPYWEAQNLSINIELDQNLAYQFTGLDDLKNNIKRLHGKIKNANIENKFIVIGQGATHILNGLIAIDSSPLVYAHPPCYHKFYDYARLAGKTWTDHENSIEIVTRPNNPDGGKYQPISKQQIYDLSYNWPTYGSIECYNQDVMVFGLSKATGHASARIGWAILKDEETAKRLENWIHLTSCGVGYYDQIVASKLIKHQLHTKETVFDFGEKILVNRWQDILLGMKLPFDRMNGRGMFLWCKGECPKELNSVNGSLLGATDEYFRLSLGVSESVWNEFKARYAK